VEVGGEGNEVESDVRFPFDLVKVGDLGVFETGHSGQGSVDLACTP
jgi:hypothetical protein